MARLATFLTMLTLSWQLYAGELESDLSDEVMEMSLEDLMAIQVTSVAKKAQKQSEAPAAIHVITQDDIRRSGVTSIAEALRLVPGLQVARIDSNSWGITARGFNALFANKLLVLMDGRSVYSTLFSGVHWEVLDTVLDDIERIEVIRGPGGTLWGANAVNGVINIITKSAADTQGGLVTAGGGTQEQGFGQLRYGGRLGADIHYRVYAKYFNRGNFVDDGGHEAADRWHMSRGGFRLDWNSSDDTSWMVQGEYYDGDMSQEVTLPTLAAPFSRTLRDVNSRAGAHLLSRWERRVSDSSALTFQIYYDRSEQEDVRFEETRDTLDLDLQYRFSLDDQHEIVWGLGYRLNHDRTDGTEGLALDPDSRTDHLFSGFLQDEITLVPRRLQFTLGCKLEHNDYTQFEYQPSARLLWTPDARHTAWAAVSRAVRTPSRADLHVRSTLTNLGVALPPGVVTRAIGNEDFRSETLLAYEFGYRVRPCDNFSLDLTAFYNQYDNLRTGELGAGVFEPTPPPGRVIIPVLTDNRMDGHTYGLEAAAQWQVRNWWRMYMGYALLKMHLDTDGSSGDTVSEDAEEESPENQLVVRSSMDLGRNLELDVMLRYVDDLPSQDIGSYTAMDVRIGWRLSPSVELAIVGQNLLDKHHAELGSSYAQTEATEAPRSVYASLTWQF